ncbi:hypothetical protein [Solidesulfovibrio sp.]|uniref:hypothetical protein n=1 Tax=Solidesulfovibrio sp. TaxID=2910990 RepID=UPI002605CCDE|nr:hypothetical protein [Solidesulfovibrio sp.]
MENYNYTISLRIRHPYYDPDYISASLGFEPEYKWKANSKRMAPDGQPLQGTYEETYCSFDLKPQDDVSLVDFIAKSNKILSRCEQFFQELRFTGGKVEYFIGMFFAGDAGEIFDINLMKGLVELGIDIAVCFYLPDSA